METLEYICKKYGVRKEKKIELPDVGRDDLAKLLKELGFKKGAEIGVLWGRYSEILCKKIPGLKLYSIDPWKVHPEFVKSETQEKLDKFYQKAKELLAPYDCEILRTKSMEAVKVFDDESLDFVYIDGNHEFTSEANDIHEWSKKVKKGGIIAGHDYRRYRPESFSHSYEVVNAYTDAYRIRPLFVIGGNRDKIKSWFWIKK